MTDEDESLYQRMETAALHIETAEFGMQQISRDVRTLIEDTIPADASVTVTPNGDGRGYVVAIGLTETMRRLQDGLEGRMMVNQTQPAQIQIRSIPDDFDVSVDALEGPGAGTLPDLVDELAAEHEEGAPVDRVIECAVMLGFSPDQAREEVERLKQMGEVYEPRTGYLRTT